MSNPSSADLRVSPAFLTALQIIVGAPYLKVDDTTRTTYGADALKRGRPPDEERQRDHRADQPAPERDAPRRPLGAARAGVEAERGGREPAGGRRGREDAGHAQHRDEESRQGAGSVRNPSGTCAITRAPAGGLEL